MCSIPTEVTGQPSNERGKAYTCERLRREAPELFEEVKAGRMSANAAAIKAGIRKKPAPLSQLVKWWKKATAEERKEFLKLMEQL